MNLALAAVDHFNRFLGLGPAQVARENLPGEAPRALEPEERKRFLRCVERSGSIRDRAMVMVLLYSGIRVSECAALDVDDVAISARKGRLEVRHGKGERRRAIPLNAAARDALAAWLGERDRLTRPSERALFVNRSERRISTRGIGEAIRKLGAEVGLYVTPHVLRHTCLTMLVRDGSDLVLVAELAGHARLETTRRYTLPSERDRQAAVDAIVVEH